MGRAISIATSSGSAIARMSRLADTESGSRTTRARE